MIIEETRAKAHKDQIADKALASARKIAGGEEEVGKWSLLQS